MSEYISANRFLTREEMQKNAAYIYRYLSPRGWTRNAIAGMLGNMETESTINPGIWQNLDAGNRAGGYGLVQWTPASKYLDWCTLRGLDPSSMVSALERIEWELSYNEQYYPTDAYPLTFREFKTSGQPAEFLALAFLANYERPADPSQPNRAQQASTWYAYLATLGAPGGGSDDDEPGGSGDEPGGSIDVPKQTKLPLWMLLTLTRRRR